MVQDFAKDRMHADPEDRHTPRTPLAWNMLLTGLLTGIVAGMFISFLAYMSGMVPPRPGSESAAGAEQAAVDDAAQDRLTGELERAATRLQLEFYQELPNYEVVVDATPLVPPAPESTPGTPPGTGTVAGTAARGYMVQAGAFQQENSALARRDQLIELGLTARVKQEALLGRTLYLVQTGPYPDRASLHSAERILRNNRIESMRIAPGSR